MIYYLFTSGFASSSASSLDSAKHSCDICEYVGPDIGSVNYHKKVKHGIKGLERHKEVIHGNIRYRCGKCDLVVSSKGALKRHIVAKHVGIRFSCDQCDFFCNYKGQLKEHKQFKHEGICFPCNECEYAGPSKGSLKRH